jgi:hypothetical protein
MLFERLRLVDFSRRTSAAYASLNIWRAESVACMAMIQFTTHHIESHHIWLRLGGVCCVPS